MKWLLIMISSMTMVLLFAGQAMTQEWYIANQKTVQWDAVTTLSNGNPIPAGDTISYEVYLVPYNEPKENAILEQATEQTQAVVTLTNEGKYFVGIRTVRLPEGETNVVRSERISWSDNPIDCYNEKTFGLKFYLLLGNSGGLR